MIGQIASRPVVLPQWLLAVGTNLRRMIAIFQYGMSWLLPTNDARILLRSAQYCGLTLADQVDAPIAD